MTKPKLEYITVKLLVQKTRRGHPSEKRKTRVYEMRLMDGRTSVGQVRWHNREHRYVFISNSGPNRIPQSADVLADIARFIEILMEERKKGIL